jgi:hypothetical protein
MDAPDQRQTQADRLRLLPNIPKLGKCRICGAARYNDIVEGSSICSVVCDICRAGMRTKRKKKPQKPAFTLFEETPLPKLTSQTKQSPTDPPVEVLTVADNSRTPVYLCSYSLKRGDD